jgi:hypothetical protein
MKAIVTKNLILNNPLMRRYRYSLLRLSQLWIYLTIFIAVIVLLLYMNYSFYQTKSDTVEIDKFCKNVYYQLLVIQIVVLWIWSTINSKSAIRNEVFNKTYDFFRLLPLSALQKTAGILLGRNLLPILFAVINFILLLIFGSLGKVSSFLQIQVILILLSTALFTNSVALLLSNTATVKKQAKTSIFVWILLLFVGAPILLPSIFFSHRAIWQIHKIENHLVEFYNINIPILLLITSILLYLSIWNVIGLVRKFTLETEPLFSRLGAVLYLLGYEAIAIGIVFPHLSKSMVYLYLFWLISLIPVVFIPVGSIKSFDRYLECCGLRRTGFHVGTRLGVDSPSRSGRGMTSALFLNSNLTLDIGLFFIWGIISAFLAMISKAEPSLYVFYLVIIFSFYLFLLLLLEIYVVYGPVLNKIAILLVFITILYLILPLLLSFTLKISSLRFYSPFGFFVHIINPFARRDFNIYTSVLIVNLLLCVIPVFLISKRYFHILTLRRKM